jgi:hypothetical protein
MRQHCLGVEVSDLFCTNCDSEHKKADLVEVPMRMDPLEIQWPQQPTLNDGSKMGERRSNPFGLLASAHRVRACSPNSVCRLIQPMSVFSACASWSALASKRAGSSKKMKFSFARASGTSSSCTERTTGYVWTTRSRMNARWRGSRE